MKNDHCTENDLDAQQNVNESIIKLIDEHNELVDENRKMRKALEQSDKYLECMSVEIYDLADCLCLEYHECVDAIDRVVELEKQLKDAKREAEDLAIFLWKKKYDNDGLGFELCDSVAGVIAQIDNMVAGMLQEEETVKFKAINPEIAMELANAYAVSSFRLGSYERIGIRAELRTQCAANKEALLRYLKTGAK